MNKSIFGFVASTLLIGASFTALPVVAQDDQVIEEVIAIGTRTTRPRTVSDSPVPVDVISGDDFDALGNTADLTDNLKAVVPSYTATPATGDGSAFVRPTSLRGTAADQTLVLVNGKRRHRSALVHIFAPAAGNGAHGVDIGMIPSIALERVEVLRDGAASQYGSDAIAGVINFVPKSNREGGEVELQLGQHFEGEDNLRVAANVGLAAGDSGFVSLSFDHTDNDALSRGIQRPPGQELIDMGVPGVGADAPFGDAPLLQTWGRPETSGTRLFLNSGFDLANDSELYFHGNYAETEGRYRFFYRGPDHGSLTNQVALPPGTDQDDPSLRDMGFTGLPAGYTPFLDGDQTDFSLVGGVKGTFSNDMTFDFSASYGTNELDYVLNNTINPSLGLTADLLLPQRNFDVGGYEQTELNLNADFSMQLRNNLYLSFGAEWREESFTVVAGEPSSFLNQGANGFKGLSTDQAGEFDRDNTAVYVDLEHDVNEDLLLQYALRFEDFSDFGSTANGKLAFRYSVSDTFALRGAASTGFHAPTPGQANLRAQITTFDGATGLQTEETIIPSTSALAVSLGGTALKEEESTNYSLGFTTDIGDFTTLTVDYYLIEVDDRIYRNTDITLPGSLNSVSFFTNSLSLEHSGIDVVLTSAIDWSNDATTDVTLAANFGDTDVVSQRQIGGVNPVSDGNVEDIENNFPDTRFVLTTNTLFGDAWNLMVRANYYGEHYDERGRIGAAVAPSFEIGSTIYVDAELGYQVNDNWRVVLGAVNIFDEFVDEIGEPFSNRLSVGLQYPRRSAANYEGGSWYLKGTYEF